MIMSFASQHITVETAYKTGICSGDSRPYKRFGLISVFLKFTIYDGSFSFFSFLNPCFLFGRLNGGLQSMNRCSPLWDVITLVSCNQQPVKQLIPSFSMLSVPTTVRQDGDH